MSSGLFNKIKRLHTKSPRVIWVRGRQELVCAWLSATSGWRRIEKKARRCWSEAKAGDYLKKHGQNPVILADDALPAIELALSHSLIDRETLLAQGAFVRARRFGVLNVAVPQEGPWPWHADWRFGHVWPKQNFRKYDHHENRSLAYDVKYPWELSRLWFLVPLMQKALMDEKIAADTSHITEVFDVLADWEAQNPLAASINWDPMEAAMRSLNLVLLFDMALLAGVSPALLAVLLRMMTVHGEFLWRTIEDTDVRGNHYAAQIVALLALGSALSGWWPASALWQIYAVEHIEDEIMQQFTKDGVNFEKASAYHGLVTELFLLAQIMMDKRKIALGDPARHRLQAACLYARALRGPGGLCPVLGDSDDARVFVFEDASSRDHRALLGLGAALFHDGRLHVGHPTPALPWLLGVAGVERYLNLIPEETDGGQLFEDGGIIAVRRAGSYLVFDAGEVGQRGLGGHGHNDLLSFELHLAGQALIVDPGSYIYTGDKKARDMFRGTRYHNGLMVDGVEIAPMTGPFRISDAARPHSVFFAEQKGIFQMQAGHSGYQRLPDPVDHLREIVFSPESQRFICKDKVTCLAEHKIERLLHFAPGVMLERAAPGYIAHAGGQSWRILFDTAALAKVFQGKVSPGYGVAAEAGVLVLSNSVNCTAELHIDIFPIKK